MRAETIASIFVIFVNELYVEIVLIIKKTSRQQEIYSIFISNIT